MIDFFYEKNWDNLKVYLIFWVEIVSKTLDQFSYYLVAQPFIDLQSICGFAIGIKRTENVVCGEASINMHVPMSMVNRISQLLVW